MPADWGSAARPDDDDTAAADVAALLNRFSRLHPSRIAPGLERITRVLAALGDPQTALPPVIHVAGTNGKGSVVAFLQAIFAAAGRTAHAYTSPHLVRFNERIALAGAPIASAPLADALARVEAANAGAEITFFEATTAAALLAMAETPGDVAIVEVGLGGRYDATNVFSAPACTVATPIALDHTEYLGDSLTKIALEKAGVFRAGAPVVIGRQDAAARAALFGEAQAVGADPILVWGADYDARPDQDGVVVETRDHVFGLPAPNLPGVFQTDNAALAAVATLASGLIPTRTWPRAMAGVAQARWPGRLQRLDRGPAFRTAHPNGAGELWLDGAHNPAAARALAQALADIDDRAPRPLVLVMSVQGVKDVAAMLEAFKGLARGVVCTAAAGGAGPMDPNDLAEAGRAAGLWADSQPSLEAALAATRGFIGPGDPAARVVVCGSLHLVGEALALNAGARRTASEG